MTVWAFENNLMWSSKLKQTLRMMGHECVVMRALPAEDRPDVAIVNLGEGDPKALIAALNARGIPTVAHAGHKEKELQQIGREAGATILATNSEVANKLPELFRKISFF